MLMVESSSYEFIEKIPKFRIDLIVACMWFAEVSTGHTYLMKF